MIDEGVIKFRLDWTETGPLDCREVAELDRWRRPLFDAGLVGHDPEHDVGYGNLSCRAAAAGQFVVTGTQTGHLDVTGPAHYALVTGYDIDSNRLACRGPVRASSESLTHAALYEAGPGIGAVVHVHHRPLWERSLGVLPTTPPEAAYGTPAMARELQALVADAGFRRLGIAVMAGHEGGLIAVGRSLAAATTRILELHAEPAAPDASHGAA